MDDSYNARTLMNPTADILREVYTLRAARRPYSLRAFARDLGLSHTYLSLVLNDKKRLPLLTLQTLGPKLDLDEARVAELVRSGERKLSRKQVRSFTRVDVDKFGLLMSRWYYVAILELREIEDFEFTPAAISRYLNIRLEETREALSVLKELGCLKFHNREWVKQDCRLSINARTSTEAIRLFHRQMIIKALEHLQKTAEADFKARDITGMTMPINPARLAGAKRRIARFRRSLENYLSQGKRTEVYQFNVQLLPLGGR